MTKQSATESAINTQPSDAKAKAHSISKEEVSDYLLKNPGFLIDSPDLLIQLQVNLQTNGVVSLSEIQALQAREKIKQLKLKLDGLLDTARKNEFIYTSYAELNLEMAKCNSLPELEQCLTKHLKSVLGLESMQLILLHDSALGPAHEFSEIQHRSIFDKKLGRLPYYFGRLGTVDKEALFPNAKAASVALIKLDYGVEATQALLAIASDNAEHFQPNMDTVLVDFLRKNLNFQLGRLR